MTHRVRADGRWVEVPVAEMGGEPLVVPNVAAILVPDRGCDAVLLQRRDKPGEVVRGRFEIPMGRWRAGETAETALRREVAEETGLDIIEILSPAPEEVSADPERPFHLLEPAAVSVGVGGAYPALNLAFVCVAPGDPRPQPGETIDPRWVSVGELRDLLETPEAFTGPTLAILTRWLALRC